MTWRRVAIIYVLAALLAAYVLVFERTEPAPEHAKLAAAPASILGIEPSSVTAVTFRKDAKVVRAKREDRRWHVVEPAGAEIPPDLFEATIATLTAGQSAETLSHQPENAGSAYGLDAPSATVELVIDKTPDQPITVMVGDRNPTRTAVYARRGDQPTIFLVGMNLSYYIDLIFDAAKT